MGVSVLHLYMMNVILKTNKFSSRRTRNRIREHGPEFRAEKSGVAGGLGIRLAWLVRAEDGWLGWLPRDEFDMSRAPAPKEGDDFRDMMPTSEEFYAGYVGWKD